MKDPNDHLTLNVLLSLLSHSTISDTTRGVYIFLFSILLRCTVLREDFLKKGGLKIIQKYYTQENIYIMQGIAYLFGYRLMICSLMYRLLGQDEELRGRIIEIWPDLPLLLCQLQSLPEDVIAANLFALQSFILTDLGKSLVIRNESEILTNILQFEQGNHLDGSSGVSVTIYKRACILLNYLFICDDKNYCIDDLSSSLLFSIISCHVPLAVNCSLKVISSFFLLSSYLLIV